jgi:hypothetical protein
VVTPDALRPAIDDVHPVACYQTENLLCLDLLLPGSTAKPGCWYGHFTPLIGNTTARFYAGYACLAARVQPPAIRLKPPWLPSGAPTIACGWWEIGKGPSHQRDSKDNVEAACLRPRHDVQRPVWIASGYRQGQRLHWQPAGRSRAPREALICLGVNAKLRTFDPLIGIVEEQSMARCRGRAAAHAEPATWCCFRLLHGLFQNYETAAGSLSMRE